METPREVPTTTMWGVSRFGGAAVKDLRSLSTLAFHAAHRVSEGALELERSPGLRRVRFYGAQVADAGVSALAHVACASAVMPPWDLQSRVEARNALRGARDCLDKLRGLLKSCEKQGYLESAALEPLYEAIEETMALVRALFLEVNGGSGIRTVA